MNTEASPRPWFVNGHSIEANDSDGLWLQNEKTGRGVVANLPSCPKSRMSVKNRKTWDAIVEANAALIVDAVNERAQLESLWARKQIHDPTGSEWHANGKLLYTKDNDFIGEMEHSADARFVCDAVNNAPLFDILLDDNKELMHDVDRLRAELSDKTRNYEDVIACHRRTEEHLRGLIKRLITVRQFVFWRKDEKTGMTYETCLMDEEEARKTVEEAKSAIGEDAK